MKIHSMPNFCVCPACRLERRRERVRFALKMSAYCAFLFVLMLAALIYVAGTAPTLQP